MEEGMSYREHGNTEKLPKHPLGLKELLRILQFIQNYAEQNAILLPGCISGFKRDAVKVIPTSATKKVMKNFIF